jgi:hypothetical protein
VRATVERGVRHTDQTAGEHRIAQRDGFQLPNLILTPLAELPKDCACRATLDGQSKAARNLAAARLSDILHYRGVESFQSRKALYLLQDDLDLFVLELQRFQLLVHQVADLHDIGDPARIVPTHHLPGQPPQPARKMERFQRMMQQGSLDERLCRHSGTAAKFGGEGRGPSAMCLFGGTVAAHRLPFTAMNAPASRFKMRTRVFFPGL